MLEGTAKITALQPPLWTGLPPRTPPNLALNTSRDMASTASLGKLFTEIYSPGNSSVISEKSQVIKWIQSR